MFINLLWDTMLSHLELFNVFITHLYNINFSIIIPSMPQHLDLAISQSRFYTNFLFLPMITTCPSQSHLTLFDLIPDNIRCRIQTIKLLVV